MKSAPIWATDAWFSPDVVFGTDNGGLSHEENDKALAGFFRPMRRYEPADGSLTPKQVSFQSRLPGMETPDFFLIGGPCPVVSARVRAIMDRFDLGSTLFHETRFVFRDGETPAPGNPYCYLNVTETKPGGFVPELSEHVCKSRYTEGLWSTMEPTKLAICASAAEGVDMWMDRSISNPIFLSEALAHALIEAGIGPAKFFPCAILYE